MKKAVTEEIIVIEDCDYFAVAVNSKKNRMLVVFRGSWSDQAAVGLSLVVSSEIRRAITKLKQKATLMVDMRGCSTKTKEIEDSMKNLLQVFMGNKYSAIAIILSGSESLNLMVKDLFNTRSRFFKEKQQAKIWLDTMGK